MWCDQGPIKSILYALDSGSMGTFSRPGRFKVLYFWAKQLTLKAPLFIQVYKWLPASWQPD